MTYTTFRSPAAAVTTRMLPAGVSGHADHVRDQAEEPRRPVNRFIHAKRHGAFVDAMNRIATAAAATWLGPDRSLEMSIAGHSRTFLCRNRSRQWQIFGEGLAVEAESIGMIALPIGIDEDVTCSRFEMELDPGDILIFHTNALTEPGTPAGKMPGETGLLDIARRALARHEAYDDLGRRLLALVDSHCGGEPSEDDESLTVARTWAYASIRSMSAKG